MAMRNRPRDFVRAHDSSQLQKLRSFLPAVALLLAVGSAPASAATFGSQLLVNGVKVQSIFKGADGATYVTFSPSTLTGCNGAYGGYLTSTWDEAKVSSPGDADSAKMQFALLLTAKATDAPLEVRYRVNTTGTGWDKCAIDAIWLQ